MKGRIIEPKGFILTAITGLFSLLLFYSQTRAFWGSLMAALMAAGLAWMTYLMLRLLLLTFRE
jgi:hypothetical protein